MNAAITSVALLRVTNFENIAEDFSALSLKYKTEVIFQLTVRPYLSSLVSPDVCHFCSLLKSFVHDLYVTWQ